MLRALVLFLSATCAVLASTSSAEHENKEVACQKVIETLGPNTELTLKEHPDVRLRVDNKQCVFEHLLKQKLPFDESQAAQVLENVVKDFAAVKFTEETAPAPVEKPLIPTETAMSKPVEHSDKIDSNVHKKFRSMVREVVDEMIDEEGSSLNILKKKLHVVIELKKREE